MLPGVPPQHCHIGLAETIPQRHKAAVERPISKTHLLHTCTCATYTYQIPIKSQLARSGVHRTSYRSKDHLHRHGGRVTRSSQKADFQQNVKQSGGSLQQDAQVLLVIMGAVLLEDGQALDQQITAFTVSQARQFSIGNPLLPAGTIRHPLHGSRHNCPVLHHHFSTATHAHILLQ